MPLSPEQVAANDQLTLAVQATLDAYGWGDSGLLGDFCVVGIQSRLLDDGDREDSYFCLLANGDIPTHHLLGLLQGQLMHQQATHFHTCGGN